MTQILQLPQLSGSLAFANNADLLMAWQFVVTGTTTAIDITGIDFHMQIRLAADLTQLALDVSTWKGTLINGGATGVLGLIVPKEALYPIAAGAYVADCLALGDGATVNLCGAAPIAVTVNEGITV